jgi:hypothetical protein
MSRQSENPAEPTSSPDMKDGGGWADYRGDCWAGFLDVSLRLRFMRSGESFGIVCTKEQQNKMERVIDHNGGGAEIVKIREDAVYVSVIKI